MTRNSGFAGGANAGRKEAPDFIRSPESNLIPARAVSGKRRRGAAAGTPRERMSYSDPYGKASVPSGEVRDAVIYARGRRGDMKLKRPRICWAFCLFAGATSACEPADFLAPSAEDATGAVLSALQIIEGGRMPNTIRFVDFAPGVHRQLVQAVRSVEWREPEIAPDGHPYPKSSIDLEVSLRAQTQAGYLFGYRYLWESSGPSSWSRAVGDARRSMLSGVIATDRVGGAWMSSTSMFRCLLLMTAGTPLEREPAVRARMLREMGFSQNAMMLRGYEFEEWNRPRPTSIN